MSSHGSRWGRLVGAAVMVGALVAGPLVGASSADTGLTSFSGEGSGFALRVVVDLSGLPDPVKSEIETSYDSFRGALPAEAQDLLPSSFPFTIDQRFIETLAEMGEATKAQALLGTGFSQKAEQTTAGQSAPVPVVAQKLPSEDLPVLDMSVGELNASVAAGPKVSADGVLAKVSATLEVVGTMLPAELQTAFDDAVADINAAIATANAELDTALSSVASAYSDVGAATDPVLGPVLDTVGLEPIVTDVTELTSTLNIPSISNPLESTLASLNGLDNDAVAEKTSDGKAMSDASSKIASVDVLGMLRVGVIDIRSHSEAAGIAGSAKNSSNCSLAEVKLGDADDGVSLDGKTLYINHEAVAVPALDVADVKDAVDGVMNAVGMSVDLCDSTVADAAADGTKASQTVSAFRVEFTPGAVADIPALGISAGDHLIKVVIDPSVQTQASAQVGEIPVGTSLPATGAAPLATIITGFAVAAGALFLRRRLA